MELGDWSTENTSPLSTQSVSQSAKPFCVLSFPVHIISIILTITSALQKEKEFFDRIRRFRVDPSTNSIANPVPDYYGEKIGSVQGYRQWLKDQRAYNRKRRNFIA